MKSEGGGVRICPYPDFLGQCLKFFSLPPLDKCCGFSGFMPAKCLITSHTVTPGVHWPSYNVEDSYRLLGLKYEHSSVNISRDAVLLFPN